MVIIGFISSKYGNFVTCKIVVFEETHFSSCLSAAGHPDTALKKNMFYGKRSSRKFYSKVGISFFL